MLTITRAGPTSMSYSVEDDRGNRGTWVRKRFDVDASGELDGRTYEFGHKKRSHFFLVADGDVVATADSAGRRTWRISLGESVYELQQPSLRRADMELRADDVVVGSVTKSRDGLRSRTVCDLPPQLPPAAQAFVGFVAMALWRRAGAADVGLAGG